MVTFFLASHKELIKESVVKYGYPTADGAISAAEAMDGLDDFSMAIRVPAAVILGIFAALRTKAFQVPYILGKETGEEEEPFIEPKPNSRQAMRKWSAYGLIVLLDLSNEVVANLTIIKSAKTWGQTFYSAYHGEEIPQEREAMTANEFFVALAYTVVIDWFPSMFTGGYAVCQDVRHKLKLPASKAPDFIKRCANQQWFRILLAYIVACSEATEISIGVVTTFSAELAGKYPQYFIPLIASLAALAGASSFFQAWLFDGSAIEESLRAIGEDPRPLEEHLLTMTSKKRVRAVKFLLGWPAKLTNTFFSMLPPTEFFMEYFFGRDLLAFLKSLGFAIPFGALEAYGKVLSELGEAGRHCDQRLEELELINERATVLEDFRGKEYRGMSSV